MGRAIPYSLDVWSSSTFKFLEQLISFTILRQDMTIVSLTLVDKMDLQIAGQIGHICRGTRLRIQSKGTVIKGN